MRATIDATHPSLYPDYLPHRRETITVADDDPNYRAWVDAYNDERVKEMSDRGYGACMCLNIPVRFGYDNPLMMLLYLSPGHGMHPNLTLMIHSVKIEDGLKPPPAPVDSAEGNTAK